MKIEQNQDIKPATKQKYRAVLKKFGRWVAFGNQAFMQKNVNPDTVAWIPTNTKSELPIRTKITRTRKLKKAVQH